MLSYILSFYQDHQPLIQDGEDLITNEIYLQQLIYVFFFLGEKFT